jgi:outer membrane protein OmpA-like peptidoglycan-associated protein
MKQEVAANAEALMNDITTTGHAAVYGIFFDTDKTDIKPESDPALSEMAKLLRGNPSLNVFIVGHTDSVGTLDHNMKLSLARAEAVVNALVTKHGIAGARLAAQGVGSLAPIGSNKTEDGKAKNRRVELVER